MSSNTNTVVATSAAAVVAGTSYLLYRSIPAILTALTKLLKNPLDEELDRVIQETGAPSYEEIAALGIVAGKSALVVGGTRGVGYGTALALAMSGASLVTVVGRSAASGSRAVSRITNELADEKSSSSSTIINFVQGDIGTVASTNALLEKLQRRDAPRYDYLIVTAAIFPQPKSRNPSPLNDDGVEKSFGVGVVGRFLLYRKAHTFMKMNHPKTTSSHSPMILNVMAAGELMPGFDRKLVRSLASFHLFNIVNFGVGNELMLHKLVNKNNDRNNNSNDNNSNSDESTATPFSIPIITTHPGFLETDLHRGQGLLMDLIETVMVRTIGCTEEECGRREVSLLCAIGSKRKRKHKSPSLLTIVDNFGIGRRINRQMEKDLNDHGDWLWELLVLMEAGGDLEKYKD